MEKGTLYSLLFLLVALSVVFLLSKMGIQYYGKKSLSYKYNQAYGYMNDSLKMMSFTDPRVYRNYLRKPRTFRMDFASNLNTSGTTQLPVEQYGTTYQNFAKNNTIETSFLGDFNFNTANKMTYFIKDYDSKIYISIDLNGYKAKPNAWGQDLFTFQVLNNGVAYPMGMRYTDYFVEASPENKNLCSKTSYSKFNGLTCSLEAKLKKGDYFMELKSW